VGLVLDFTTYYVVCLFRCVLHLLRVKLLQEGRTGYLDLAWGPMVLQCLQPSSRTFSNLSEFENFCSEHEVSFKIVEGHHRYTLSSCLCVTSLQGCIDSSLLYRR